MTSWASALFPQGPVATLGKRKKRPQVSKACPACRRAKVKCSGTFPCDSCIIKGLECAGESIGQTVRALQVPDAATVEFGVQELQNDGNMLATGDAASGVRQMMALPADQLGLELEMGTCTIASLSKGAENFFKDSPFGDMRGQIFSSFVHEEDLPRLLALWDGGNARKSSVCKIRVLHFLSLFNKGGNEDCEEGGERIAKASRRGSLLTRGKGALPTAGSRYIPMAAYIPLEVRLIALPGAEHAVLMSNSYTRHLEEQNARLEAAGGLNGMLDRMKSKTGQYQWNPSAGGDQPGELRKAQGGRCLMMDPDHSGALSEDLSWLRRVATDLRRTTVEFKDTMLHSCQESLTNFIHRFLIWHLTLGVDQHGTPFCCDFLRLRLIHGAFESSWRFRAHVALDGSPVAFANRPGTYLVPFLCYDEEALTVLEMYCRAPPGQTWSIASAGPRAKAQGLLCNLNGPSSWRFLHTGETEEALVYTARPVLPEFAPVAKTPEAQRRIRIIAKRIGPPDVAVGQRLYDSEIWSP